MKRSADGIKDSFKLCLESGGFIALLASAFIIASAVELYSFNISFADIGFIEFINIPLFATAFAAAFVLILSVSIIKRSPRVIPNCLMCSAVIYSVMLVRAEMKNIWFNLGIVMILFIIFRWLYKDDKLSLEQKKLPKHFAVIACTVIFLLSAGYFAWSTVLNYTAYYTPSHDFGLFAQMFDNMRETGLPYTTMERNASMSHFGVHFSPIYYLLLPFYCLAPRPEMLYVMQAVAVASGIFAVYKIARHFKLPDYEVFLITLIYAFYPSLFSGLYNYFHENKFLTVLILWTVYFMLKKKTVPMFVFALLVLSVKEDAAIYIIAIAAYMILSRREYIKGFSLLVLAIIWFVGAVKIVDVLGDGVMSDRLKNYWQPDTTGGFADVIKSCLFNIGYLISQVFTKEKLEFILWILVPVLFVPFFGEKIGTLVLLIPMLVVNLMSNYKLQYNILYQYTYGTAALVIFMFIIVAGAMTLRKRRYTMLLSAVICAVFAVSLVSSLAKPINNLYNATKEECRASNEIIASIPKDADVTAHTMLAAHLADRNEVYIFPAVYGEFVESTYLLLDTRYDEHCTDDYISDYEFVSAGGFCELYKLKDSQ